MRRYVRVAGASFKHFDSENISTQFRNILNCLLSVTVNALVAVSNRDHLASGGNH